MPRDRPPTILWVASKTSDALLARSTRTTRTPRVGTAFRMPIEKTTRQADDTLVDQNPIVGVGKRVAIAGLLSADFAGLNGQMGVITSWDTKHSRCCRAMRRIHMRELM